MFSIDAHLAPNENGQVMHSRLYQSKKHIAWTRSTHTFKHIARHFNLWYNLSTL